MLAFRLLLVSALVSMSQCVETSTDHVDGGACHAVCGPAKPHCDEASMSCVECLGDAHCVAPFGTCDLATHACVACAGNASCEDPTKPICDLPSGACQACANDTECAGMAATPVCDEASGRCVACTPDTEAARCGGNSCDRATFTCTGTWLHSVVRCGECQGDSECPADHVCVTRAFQGTALGAYCLPRKPVDGCGSTMTNPSYLPYSISADVTSVDKTTATVCSPRDSVSCESMVLLGVECTPPASGTRDDSCGNPIVGDGHCIVPPAQSARCTYRCLDAGDCKDGFVCGIAPSGTDDVCR